MHQYFIRTPWMVAKLFPDYIWRFPDREKTAYLTFDDGPHPEITPWVLQVLRAYGAKATFFCIGHNVLKYPEVLKQVIAAGHSIGNHTYHHLNGWKVDKATYLADVAAAAELVDADLFRPPYGRLKSGQAKGIAKAMGREHSKVIMWDVLSGDFDRAYTPEQCLEHVTKYTRPGSVVVFHDSEKALKNLQKMLPKALDFLKNEGYMLKKIEL